MMGARKNVRVNLRVFVCEFGSWEFASFEIFYYSKIPPVSLHIPIYSVFQNLFLNYEDGWLVGSLVISDLFAMFYV
jgi:hypothetical protein